MREREREREREKEREKERVKKRERRKRERERESDRKVQPPPPSKKPTVALPADHLWQRDEVVWMGRVLVQLLAYKMVQIE